MTRHHVTSHITHQPTHHTNTHPRAPSIFFFKPTAHIFIFPAPIKAIAALTIDNSLLMNMLRLRTVVFFLLVSLVNVWSRFHYPTLIRRTGQSVGIRANCDAPSSGLFGLGRTFTKGVKSRGGASVSRTMPRRRMETLK